MAATTAYQKDSRGVIKWLNDHPDSPLHDTVANAASNMFASRGKENERIQFRDAIGCGKVSGQVEAETGNQ